MSRIKNNVPHNYNNEFTFAHVIVINAFSLRACTSCWFARSTSSWNVILTWHHSQRILWFSFVLFSFSFQYWVVFVHSFAYASIKQSHPLFHIWVSRFILDMCANSSYNPRFRSITWLILELIENHSFVERTSTHRIEYLVKIFYSIMCSCSDLHNIM